LLVAFVGLWEGRRLQEFAVTGRSTKLDTAAASARLIFDEEVEWYSQRVSLPLVVR